jgi:hypothetical protein
MPEYGLFAAFDIMKRHIELDLLEENRDAVKQCDLAWKGSFSSDIEALRNESRFSSAVRWRYPDTAYGFVTFVRNRLVHERDICNVAQRIRQLGDPLDIVLRALIMSQNEKVGQLIGLIQALKPASSRLERALQGY